MAILHTMMAIIAQQLDRFMLFIEAAWTAILAGTKEFLNQFAKSIQVTMTHIGNAIAHIAQAWSYLLEGEYGKALKQAQEAVKDFKLAIESVGQGIDLDKIGEVIQGQLENVLSREGEEGPLQKIVNDLFNEINTKLEGLEGQLVTPIMVEQKDVGATTQGSTTQNIVINVDQKMEVTEVTNLEKEEIERMLRQSNDKLVKQIADEAATNLI